MGVVNINKNKTDYSLTKLDIALIISDLGTNI